MSTQLSLPKDKIRILLLEGIHDSAVALLKASGYENVTRHKGALEGDALKKALEGVHIVGIRSRTQLTKEVIDGADRLVAIGCFCIGTNQVDLDAARMNGIPVFNAPYSNTRSVAELVMGEVVMLMRRIFPRSNECHVGTWNKSASNSWEVRGKTLGIVGYGSIGSQLSVLAEAFGMRVIYFDVVDKLGHGNAGSVDTLEELLAESDVVSLHVPQLPTTKNLMGAAQIRAMKKGSFLINNARGNVVDLDALAEALKDGHLLGAAIDVFPKEPKGPNDQLETPLKGLDNVILTPHIGGSTAEAQERIGVEVARKLVEYSDVGSTFGSVNFPGVQLPQSPRGTRFMHVHHNVPGMMMRLNEIFLRETCNVTAQFLQTDGEIGYVVVEADTGHNTDLDDRILQALRELDGTIRARLIYKGR
ncbi:phosphoglycerate dehydrogenase [Acetobacter indonesiensis]|jgi:D-3-phosphoglycerate dehydrogenase|uniref:2-oxoglutarate reductase n=1 Tax=Acetobacter indonesiensis TaxID=104101 RepID=A0A252AV86_9PROT|nr:phosphoglycerate dehydrogenase [Acetobacter indonesiensis]MCG0995734.1 phosphoglycerate dehydrogenase [Acetobacter indonesiensis]MCP1230784.1 phosphoglycerate dehydrogenase [Acetobacter indonesiensis]OUI94266.1 3-phosphoglycerate dehydrogenase [Acetobacter indonesiensis]OUI95742.1 3-phosphoglycerate dehydrogenase [Acetobacter indonesiensis]GAN63885.1 D-3-phosphoglycerate dehydrogenase [Acetobacter indonesiensis]